MGQGYCCNSPCVNNVAADVVKQHHGSAYCVVQCSCRLVLQVPRPGAGLASLFPQLFRFCSSLICGKGGLYSSALVPTLVCHRTCLIPIQKELYVVVKEIFAILCFSLSGLSCMSCIHSCHCHTQLQHAACYTRKNNTVAQTCN